MSVMKKPLCCEKNVIYGIKFSEQTFEQSICVVKNTIETFRLQRNQAELSSIKCRFSSLLSDVSETKTQKLRPKTRHWTS